MEEGEAGGKGKAAAEGGDVESLGTAVMKIERDEFEDGNGKMTGKGAFERVVGESEDEFVTEVLDPVGGEEKLGLGLGLELDTETGGMMVL